MRLIIWKRIRVTGKSTKWARLFVFCQIQIKVKIFEGGKKRWNSSSLLKEEKRTQTLLFLRYVSVVFLLVFAFLQFTAYKVKSVKIVRKK